MLKRPCYKHCLFQEYLNNPPRRERGAPCSTSPHRWPAIEEAHCPDAAARGLQPGRQRHYKNAQANCTESLRDDGGKAALPCAARHRGMLQTRLTAATRAAQALRRRPLPPAVFAVHRPPLAAFLETAHCSKAYAFFKSKKNHHPCSSHRITSLTTNCLTPSC